MTRVVGIQQRQQHSMRIETPYNFMTKRDHIYICHSVLVTLSDEDNIAPDSHILRIDVMGDMVFESPVILLQRKFISAFNLPKFRKLYRRTMQQDNPEKRMKNGRIIEIDDCSQEQVQDGVSANEIFSTVSQRQPYLRDDVGDTSTTEVPTRLTVPIVFMQCSSVDFYIHPDRSCRYVVMLDGIETRPVS